MEIAWIYHGMRVFYERDWHGESWEMEQKKWMQKEWNWDFFPTLPLAKLCILKHLCGNPILCQVVKETKR